MILGSLQAHASRQLIDNQRGGVCPTIGTTDFGLPKVIEKMENEDIKPKVVGKLKYDSDFDCGARIYDTDGIAPTQQTITGGNLETKIIEYMDNKEQTIISKPHGYFKGSENKDISPCVKSSAMAENNFVKETITDMSKKENIEQKEPTIGAIRTRSYKGQPTTLEQSGSTESNAITSVQKDNVVIEPINTTEPLNPYNDGTSRTIKGQYQCTSTANLTRGDSLGATGAITFNGREYHEGEGLYTNVSKDYIRGGLDGMSRSLKSGNMDSGVVQNFRIRKLTPRECFRLMDVSEPDIDKLLNAGISNSQLYKLAGNSVVVSCLYHLFRKMFIETDMDYTGKPQQLSLF